MTKKTWLMPVSSASPPVAPIAPIAPIAPATPVTTPVPSASSTGGSIDPLSMLILSVNYNPYLVGLFMILLNLGSRYLGNLLTKKQDAFLQSSILRPFIFFAVVFIATRNLVVAFWVSVIFFFIIWVIANEDSKYCIIPYWCNNQKDIKESVETYAKNIEKIINSTI